MPFKKFLMIAGAFAVFALAAVIGYFGPNWIRMREDAALMQSFTPPHVPSPISDAFAHDFNTLYAADRPMTMPDVPFADIHGKPVRISDFKGKPLLVNFWATWCTPCVVELPELKRFAQYYDGKLQVIGVALEPGKGPEEISKFLENRNIGDFAAYSDKSGQFGEKLGLRGVPTSFLIGSNGLIMYRFEGDANWTSAQSKAFFDSFLAGSAPAKSQ